MTDRNPVTTKHEKRSQAYHVFAVSYGLFSREAVINTLCFFFALSEHDAMRISQQIAPGSPKPDPTMTPEETNCFTLLDDYARTHHGCFLAEFFLSSIQTDYVLCFRLATGGADSPNRYACRYLYIGPDLVRTAGQDKKLQECITELLDTELPKLAKS